MFDIKEHISESSNGRTQNFVTVKGCKKENLIANFYSHGTNPSDQTLVQVWSLKSGLVVE